MATKEYMVYAQNAKLAARNDEIKTIWDEQVVTELMTPAELAEAFNLTEARIYQIVGNPYSHLVRAN